MSKSIILRSFNTYYFDFLDRLIEWYPEHEELQVSKTTQEMFKKTNPTLIIKYWAAYVYKPYANAINEGNLEYFLNKDYNEDIQNAPSSGIENSKMLEYIENVKDIIRIMDPLRQRFVIEYVQNLSKMSIQYSLL